MVSAFGFEVEKTLFHLLGTVAKVAEGFPFWRRSNGAESLHFQLSILT